MSLRPDAWRNHFARAQIIASRDPEGRVVVPWSTIQASRLARYIFAAFVYKSEEKVVEKNYE